ncbi:hypothetical protein D6C81_10625 [Aureobasidium pullulans]|nr:hypothetical protein D6C81_10625 [Aureobasidium pullulans]
MELQTCHRKMAERNERKFFPEEEHTRLRELVPVAARSDVTFLNAGFMPPMNARVRVALEEFLRQASTYPNPKPLWQATTTESRTKLAQFLNVPAHSIAFTRDTTEGLNLFQRSLQFNPGDNVVLLDVEHPNHAYGWLGLQQLGLEVRLISTENTFFANAATFEHYVDEKTIAIGISSVMFHSGQKNDVQDIAAQFRPRGVHVLVDITQHIGAGKIDLAAWNVSAAAFSTHKALGCPTGLGALYINPDVVQTLKTAPPVVGAGSIANLSADLVAKTDVVYHSTAQRYEHLNLSLIGTAALKASLSFVADEMGIGRIEDHLRALGQDLADKVEKLGLQLVGSRSREEHAPHVYVLPLLHSDWKDHFAKEQVIVSHYRCGVRVSFGFYNNTSDIDHLVSVVARGLAAGISK